MSKKSVSTLKDYKWKHEPARRNQTNDAAKINERTDEANNVVTFFRELLQNLVDAKKGKNHSVEIKLFDDTRTNYHLNKILDDVTKRAEVSSAITDKITIAASLVIHETDYHGLTGPMNQIKPHSDAKSSDHFHNFFFVQSKRSKGAQSGGGKGIGKITYFLASSVRTVFVAMNRHKEKHKYGLFGMSEHEQTYFLDDVDWDYLSYWVSPESDDETHRAKCETETVDDFLSPFKYLRSESSGNTWVIPGVDANLYSNDFVIKTIIEQYYVSVIDDELRIKVGEISINQSTLNDLIEKHSPQLQGEVDFVVDTKTANDSNIEVVDLTHFEIINLDKKIGELLEGERTRISQAYDEGKLIRFDAIARVKKIGKNETKEPFFIWAKKDDSLEEPVVLFHRYPQNIPIEAKNIKESVRGNFYARIELKKESELSKFSAYAENDAHTKLVIQKELSAKYEKPHTTLKDLRGLSSSVLRFLNQQQFADTNLLADFFSISGGGTKIKKTPAPPRPPIPKPSGPKFLLTKDGEEIRIDINRHCNVSVGSKLEFEFAYKSAFSKSHFKDYSDFDFDLETGKGMNINSTGAKILLNDKNKLDVTIESLPMKIEIKGFGETYEIVARMEVI